MHAVVLSGCKQYGQKALQDGGKGVPDDTQGPLPPDGCVHEQLHACISRLLVGGLLHSSGSAELHVLCMIALHVIVIVQLSEPAKTP